MTAAALRRALVGVDTVFHFAAQVAVTTSVDEPAHDFEVNLGGTFALLDEIRQLPTAADAAVHVDQQGLRRHGRPGRPSVTTTGTCTSTRRSPAGGSPRSRPLSFCSPYGCSKGGADQYVIDFAKTYGIPAVVFRMSCIYGPHQCGNEDQGWVAHFLLQAMAGKPITIFGDGRQVRDALFVDDLVDAMDLAVSGVERFSGRAFNIGGGPAHTISLLELLDIICDIVGKEPEVSYDGLADRRPALVRLRHPELRGRPPGGHRTSVSPRACSDCTAGTSSTPTGCRWAAREPQRSRRRRPRSPERRPSKRSTSGEPRAGEVLVDVAGCGVCGSNVPVWEGRPWFTYPLAPGLPGHEAWGQVAAVGADVDGRARGRSGRGRLVRNVRRRGHRARG